MKSSYLLYGTYWDHKPSTDIDVLNFIPYIQGVDYCQPFCIFDLLGEYRTIRISELLSIEKDDDWILLCNQLRKFKNIAISIDYLPHMSSRESSLFFKKRLRQIYRALQNELTDASIVLQVPPKYIVEWKTIQTFA